MTNVMGKISNTKASRREKVIHAFNKIKNINRFESNIHKFNFHMRQISIDHIY